ncbi:MAG: T9SS type A sorting domain-containing protein [Bacteroidales bacterium]|nr:T9SS type A sorting domain-containing protein [Bacteroidales bacterium]
MKKSLYVFLMIILCTTSFSLTFRSSISQTAIGECKLGSNEVKSGIQYLNSNTGKSKSGVTEPLNLPLSYELEQNYPNPFNPTTTIAFTLPVIEFVSLKIYNVLGNEVADLAGKEYMKGKHNIVFNADKFVSGMYFYKIQTPGFTKMRKMMLVK